ncbi:hypothetical protein [Rubripirellula reticaptiva]|uniref:hypothetical protein n=1 Tax=Rubripirellula reticaptiva TaxID=2528013 RepID=UPI001C949B59|nr:hypothetical protein [Rubripirellula reticaptiva]
MNPGQWTGTKEQWLKHYDYTVAAVRSVLPGAEIGPGNVVATLKAHRQESWAPAIINHCASGTNHVSGQTGSPLDFFGSFCYTTVGRTDKNFEYIFRFLRNRLDSRPESSGIPIEIQEFGILSEGGKRIIGESVPVQLTLDQKSLASKDWTLTRANLIDGDHAEFIGKRDSDVKKTLSKYRDQRRPDAVALRRAMAVNRNEYELMSNLHSLDPLPKPTRDSSGQRHFDLTMDGHTVLLLRLE